MRDNPVMTRLPVDDALPALRAALARHGRAVLEAPPGAGKTTRVPPALLGDRPGKIVMLEPRRIAARAAAERIADELGEPVGRQVGYRVRGDTVVSRETRIEVVTEGILTRMAQADPGLDGIGTLVFDEFHERSLDADLGLALALEIREALRPDLAVVVMSATLDTAPVAALLGDAPVIRAEGQSFPVETRWRDRPVARETRFDAAAADLVSDAVAATTGGALVFLPGEGEIRRVAARLEARLPKGCVLRPLYGALPLSAQRAAIAPGRAHRKVVLATSIAETSLTIEDIRVVVDAGRTRRARFDPGSGMSRLVTERVTRAEADQRRGRAGRVAPGVCYRMWTKGEEGGLAPFPPAEIEIADLAGLALDLALWGADSADGLSLLTPPNPGAWAEARALLGGLGALDASGRITDHGRELARLPLHPRLAHMLALAGPGAAPLAALLADRDPLRGASADLEPRLRAVAAPGKFTPPAGATFRRDAAARIAAEARRLARRAPATGRGSSVGAMAALAYPDRIALRRPGSDPRFTLSGGKGAALPPDDPLAGHRLLVAVDLDGDPREARIRLAAPLTEAELRDVHGTAIAWHDLCAWSRREGRVVARRQERFGALVLDDRVWRDAPATALAEAALDGVRELGLPWSDGARRLQARAVFAAAAGASLPDLSDAALEATLTNWLLPFLGDVRTADQIRALDLEPALRALVGWQGMQELDRVAPAEFTTPTGRRIPVDYSGPAPEISVRLQEMFGVARHPELAGRKLRVTLLSPAGRPLQTTMDLPGFWQSSYADVRKDMRGRYPKHAWPDDPLDADPVRGPKRRAR